MNDKIRCEICGKEFKIISTTHLKQHGFTFDDYKSKYPNSKLKSELSKSKLGITKEKLIQLYGNEEGLKRWEEYCYKQSLSNTFDYKKEKYNWTEEQFDEYNKSRSVTKENCIKKHGIEKGLKLWDNYRIKQSYMGCKLEYFIKKYGEEKGKIFYENLNKSKNNNLESMIKKYGNEEGTQRYKNKCEKKFYNLSKNNFGVSDIQLTFLDMLVSKLPEEFNIHCGLKDNKEFHRWDEIERKHWLYDFVISSPIKICIEFNGDYWHANPKFYKNDDKIKFPKTNEQLAEDIWEKDFKKLNNLIKKEFHTKIIWENDFRNKPNEIVEECYQWIMKLNQLNQLKE